MVLIATSAAIKTIKQRSFQYLQLARIIKGRVSRWPAIRYLTRTNIIFTSATQMCITSALRDYFLTHFFAHRGLERPNLEVKWSVGPIGVGQSPRRQGLKQRVSCCRGQVLSFTIKARKNESRFTRNTEGSDRAAQHLWMGVVQTARDGKNDFPSFCTVWTVTVDISDTNKKRGREFTAPWHGAFSSLAAPHCDEDRSCQWIRAGISSQTSGSQLRPLPICDYWNWTENTAECT